MIYLIVALVGILSIGGIYFKISHDGYNKGLAACQEKLAEAQEEARQEGEKRKAAAAVKIQDMQSAFEAGEMKGQAMRNKQLSKGIQNATTDKGLLNTSCVLDNASLLDIQSARSGLRSSTNSGKTP